jgi:hypothetical protein
MGGNNLPDSPNPSARSSIVMNNNAMLASHVVASIAQDDPLGGLFLVSRILNFAFQYAKEYQEKQQIFLAGSNSSNSYSTTTLSSPSSMNKSLPMVWFLGYFVMSDVNKMVSNYVEEFIREATAQVRIVGVRCFIDIEVIFGFLVRFDKILGQLFVAHHWLFAA